ncbi:hypothetical protein DPMN_129853 [Dreissena polymorpha]|uniref:Uncharacterized protein n=1 Tax=Dreissena polymorpha TaxID=45954 RepID=A0A9D4H408_DREPO|nr:hypothetical protein DPMN_129853 [Dreissena polymorpha]
MQARLTKKASVQNEKDPSPGPGGGEHKTEDTPNDPPDKPLAMWGKLKKIVVVEEEKQPVPEPGGPAYKKEATSISPPANVRAKKGKCSRYVDPYLLSKYQTFVNHFILGQRCLNFSVKIGSCMLHFKNKKNNY